MPRMMEFPTFSDHRGSLTVMEKTFPFQAKRLFLVYDFKAPRGGHGHLQSKTILFAVSGALKVEVRVKGQSNSSSQFFILDRPDRGLFLDPEDWHAFSAEVPGTVLLVVASHEYRQDDYFYERP